MFEINFHENLMKKLSDFKYEVDYKWVKTRIPGDKKEFDLSDPAQRKLYFAHKAGDEIHKLREFMKSNTFIVYMMAPKMAGKSTYLNLLREIVGEDAFETVSVGDQVRNAHEDYEKNGKKSDVYKYCSKNYRGMMSLDDAFDALVGRSAAKLLPTEFILTLIKMAIEKVGRKTIFLDGFPRSMDQVSYSLYFRELVDFRDDPDLFLLMHLPVAVIDARIKARRACPKCRDSRNLVLLPTKEFGYDEEEDEFYLMCDNPGCEKTRLEPKEGDDKGIGTIENRLTTDLELMQQARKMHRIPKIELYNSVHKEKAAQLFEDYELTKESSYKVGADGIVTREEKSFVVKDHGEDFVSLHSAPVAIQLVRQLVNLFCA